MGDDSWVSRPKFISDEIVQIVADRVVEQIETYSLQSFAIEIHGGEPLLFGINRMRSLLETFEASIGRQIVRFSLQTNGLLLNADWVDLFEEYNVHVGISLDGPPSPNPLRLTPEGNDSTPQLIDVLDAVRSSRPRFSPGILAVLSDDSDIRNLIDWFPSNGFRSFDFLLPLGNYVSPPVGITNKDLMTQKLIEAFDYWHSLKDNRPQIRFFEIMIIGLMGHEIVLDSFGGDLRRLCVVESDGSIGANDVIRFCGGTFSEDSINVKTHTLDTHSEHFRLESIQKLCAKCRSCDMLNACGGGYLPDRFDGKTFDNPSYYCDVIYAVSRHIFSKITATAPKESIIYQHRVDLDNYA